MRRITRVLFVLLAAGAVRAELPGEEPLELSPSTATTVTTIDAPNAVLRIVHPPEGARLPHLKSSFVYGSADPSGSLTVNGRPVPIHKGGGWITMVDYTPGAFTINAELRTRIRTYTASRRVQVAGPVGAFPVTPATVRATAPEVDMEVRAGDWVTVSAQGSPGLEASFHVEGAKGTHPMAESPGSRGVYRGVYRVRADDHLDGSKVKVTLVNKTPGQRANVNSTADGKLWRFKDELFMVEVSTDLAILRAAPGPYAGDKAGYILFPPLGTRLEVTGRRGAEYRVALSERREAWIGQDEVRGLPDGAPPVRTLANAISVEPEGRHTLVRLSFGQKIPFEVRPSDDRETIDVVFFGAASNTDWAHYNAPNGAVRRVEWFQDETDVYRLRIHARPGRWWGYDARFEGSVFVLELRRPPANPKNPSSLEGLRVVVDAGHSADPGARGPTGLLEKDANLAIAKCLEKKLRAEKADVEMIRLGNESVGLYDRPKLAWAARGDVLISVHNNALPEGANPFERNGFGVYYFHGQSFRLAEAIHEAYGEMFSRSQTRSTKLRDDGLHYGNLALPRTSQMPAVLTESAYVIYPPEEALLKTETFQCDCAEATVRGLKRFVRETRQLDAP